MTFLELAQKIDEAKARVKVAEEDVKVATTSIELMKARHLDELMICSLAADDTLSVYKQAEHELNNLFAQMAEYIPVSKASSPASQTDKNLKQLWIDNQKRRSN